MCVCDYLPEGAPLQTRTRIVLLVHPQEAVRKQGTMPLLRACLRNLIIKVDDHFPAPDDDMDLHEAMCADGYRCVLVCPGPDAKELHGRSDEEIVASDPRLISLIFIDGRWNQAQSMVHRSPWLRNLERVVLAPQSQSGYVFLQQPAKGCLSTLEAVAEALLALEGSRGPELKAGLLAPFHRMVELQCRFIPTVVDKNAERTVAHTRPFDFAAALTEASVAGWSRPLDGDSDTSTRVHCVVRWGEKSVKGRVVVVVEVLQSTLESAKRRATELSEGRTRGNRCWVLSPDKVPSSALYEASSNSSTLDNVLAIEAATGAAISGSHGGDGEKKLE